MTEYSILEVLSAIDPPVELRDATCVCPGCENEVDINTIIIDGTSIKCDNCDHRIVFKIKRI